MKPLPALRLLGTLLALACTLPAGAQDTKPADAAAAPDAPPKPTGAVIPPTMDLSRPAGSTDEAAPAEAPAAPAPAAQDAPVAPAAPVLAAITPEVEAPRPFGYVIGDMVVQRIALDHDGARIEPAKLPPLERADNWFERRDARIEQDAAGRRWLVIDYQIINVPDELRALELPALDLELTDGKRRLQTTPLPITVAPLTPEVVLARAGLEAMRPDLPAPHIDPAPFERGLHAALSAGAALVGLWLLMALLRQVAARRRLPFSRAQRELGRLDSGSPDSWRRLHRALDDTAGQVVRDGNLDVLLARAPWLTPLEADLRSFFEASQARFFADRPAGDVDPRTLCARAAKLERRALA